MAATAKVGKSDSSDQQEEDRGGLGQGRAHGRLRGHGRRQGEGPGEDEAEVKERVGAAQRGEPLPRRAGQAVGVGVRRKDHQRVEGEAGGPDGRRAAERGQEAPCHQGLDGEEPGTGQPGGDQVEADEPGRRPQPSCGDP